MPADAASRDVREQLERGLEAFDISHPDPAALLASLERLILLLLRWSRRIDLTGHRTPGAVVRRLIFDAFGLATLIPPARSLADLGSGAGFPGLPLALLRPELRVTLVEARERRHHFQRAVTRDLALSNVRPLLGRAEALAPEPNQVVVAQAVARPERALRWMHRWAEPRGLLVIPLGDAERSIQTPTGVRGSTKCYRLPLEKRNRFVWLGRCTGDSRGES